RPPRPAVGRADRRGRARAVRDVALASGRQPGLGGLAPRPRPPPTRADEAGGPRLGPVALPSAMPVRSPRPGAGARSADPALSIRGQAVEAGGPTAGVSVTRPGHPPSGDGYAYSSPLGGWPVILTTARSCARVDRKNQDEQPAGPSNARRRPGLQRPVQYRGRLPVGASPPGTRAGEPGPHHPGTGRRPGGTRRSAGRPSHRAGAGGLPQVPLPAPLRSS